MELFAHQKEGIAFLREKKKVILADEPTGSLDSASSEQVFQILRDLVDKNGKTVVAVTHDLDLAARMDRRVHLVDGRIVQDEAAWMHASTALRSGASMASIADSRWRRAR